MSENQQVNDQQPNETPSDPFSTFLHHEQRAFTETGKALEALLPPGFKEHSQEAGREFVSGVKVLFDAALEGMQKASKDFEQNMNRQRSSGSDNGDHPSSTGATKVKVQVD